MPPSPSRTMPRTRPRNILALHRTQDFPAQEITNPCRLRKPHARGLCQTHTWRWRHPTGRLALRMSNAGSYNERAPECESTHQRGDTQMPANHETCVGVCHLDGGNPFRILVP
jgi:hypothetical protein